MSLHWDSFVTRQAPPPLTPEILAYDNSPQILTITGSFFAAAALVVLLRCYVRIAMLKVFGVDDYVMVLAMILCTATFVCFKLRVDQGLGKHFAVIMMNPAKSIELFRIQYVQAIIIMVAVSTVKSQPVIRDMKTDSLIVSIAFCLLRLSVHHMYARFLYGSVAFIVLMTLACAGTLIFQCLPVQAAWDTSLRPPPLGTGTAKCYNMIIFRNLGLMNSSFNIVTDVLFALLPMPLIWRLQLNRRTKISLMLILSLGWFACAAAIIKAIHQWRILTDFDWTTNDSFNVWNMIELCVGIIAASLPTLKPLFNFVLETARSLTTFTTSHHNHSHRRYTRSRSKGSFSSSHQSQQYYHNALKPMRPSRPSRSPLASLTRSHTKSNTSVDVSAVPSEWNLSPFASSPSAHDTTTTNTTTAVRTTFTGQYAHPSTPTKTGTTTNISASPNPYAVKIGTQPTGMAGSAVPPPAHARKHSRSRSNARSPEQVSPRSRGPTHLRGDSEDSLRLGAGGIVMTREISIV